MTFVSTTCARCGTIEVPLTRVLLRFCEPDGAAVCVMRCPRCGSRFVREANEAMASAMLALGAEVSVVGTDVGTRRPSGLGQITSDELEEFCAVLERDDAIVAQLHQMPQ